MSSNQLLYLSRTDVEEVGLDIKTIIHLLEEAFRAKGAGQVEMPPKPGIHTCLYTSYAIRRSQVGGRISGKSEAGPTLYQRLTGS